MKIKSDLTNSDEIRWRRRKDARPDEILHAALECFAERGFTATKLDDVAARSGVSKGTLYLYFENKEELFKAVVRTELLPNIAKIEKKLSNENLSAGESLRRLLVWAKNFTTSKLAPIPKLVIAEGGNFPELAKFYSEEVVGRLFALIGSILQKGIERSEFRQVNVENAACCLIAPAIFSMLYTHTLEPHAARKLDVESLFETHLELILRGLANDVKK